MIEVLLALLGFVICGGVVVYVNDLVGGFDS